MASILRLTGHCHEGTELIARDDTTGDDFKAPDIAMIVEDDMIIAMDAEDILRSLGVGEVHHALSVAEAETLMSEKAIAFALLDMSLGAETSEPIARRLHTANTPFCFTTGYGEGTGFDAAFSGVPLVQKPYDTGNVRNAMITAIDGRDARNNDQA